jgi:hypothetical protein
VTQYLNPTFVIGTAKDVASAAVGVVAKVPTRQVTFSVPDITLPNVDVRALAATTRENFGKTVVLVREAVGI